jgi:hypothetical protein
MKKCGWTKLIMFWKITRAGKKANLVVRVNWVTMGNLMAENNLEENVLKRSMKANLN